MNRKLLFAILVIFTAASLAACGSSSSNPTEIAFNVTPPADLQVGASVTLSAAVFNNTTTGINWTVACGSANCGSLSATNTDSDVNVTYTAPPTVPSGNTVTITATSVAKSSVSVSATITITSSSTGTALNGQYAFLISGSDSNGPYFAAGSITADGNGNITGGEEDLCDTTGCGTALVSGTFSTGSDGRGSIDLNSTTLGAQTLNIVVTSASHALVIEFDASATSSGTLDLQDPNALSQGGAEVTGGYSIAVGGIDADGNASALGGIMAADGSGGFANGVTLDVNEGGTVSVDTTSFGVITAPDASGRTVVGDGQLEFVYYTVNAKALRFIEVDQSFFLTSGSAYTQGTGSLTVANLAGNSAFTESGTTAAHSGGALGLAGQFIGVTNGGSVASGFVDINDNGSISNGSIAGSSFANFASARGTLTLSGGVSSDVTQFDVYLVDPSVNILDPTNATGGGGALLLDSDQNVVGTGEIILQTSGAQFSGNYGLNEQAFMSSEELDLEGQVGASGSSLTGNGDLNDFGNLLPAESLSGSFTADSANPGRFTGSLTVGSFGTFTLVFYQASSSQIVLVEVDKDQIGTGVLVEQ